MFIRNYSFIRETRVGGVGKGEGPCQRTMEGSKTGREGKLFLKVNQEDRFGHFLTRNGLKLRFLLGSSRLRQGDIKYIGLLVPFIAPILSQNCNTYIEFL